MAGDILMGVNRGRNFRDTAVLYRMNAQSNALEYALKRNAIPYKVVGGMKFFDRAEVKDMLAYLCVLNNPMDDLRLRRIINTPARGIGATTMDKVAELAAEQGASLYEVIRNADLFPTLKTAASCPEAWVKHECSLTSGINPQSNCIKFCLNIVFLLLIPILLLNQHLFDTRQNKSYSSNLPGYH